MVHTQGKQMFLTPTYHVFEMYKGHQGATLLPSDLTCNVYENNGQKLPALNVSASKSKDGTVTITLCNLDPTVPAELECSLEGMTATKVSGRVLTADAMNAHNTFEKADAVKPAPFNAAELKDGTLRVTLPAKSIVTLEVR